MGIPDSGALLQHLRQSAFYRAAFDAAFHDDRARINYDNVGRAIGAFERGLVTPSRWDTHLADDTLALSPAEKQGLVTFARTGGATCHSGAYVGGRMYQQLGLVKPWPALTDSGRVLITKVPTDLFVFKVPSLRNVVMTSPYFHDGSVASLQTAIRLMARHQLNVEFDNERIASIHTWLGALTGELPAAYIAEPQLPRATKD